MRDDFYGGLLEGYIRGIRGVAWGGEGGGGEAGHGQSVHLLVPFVP